MMMTTTGDSDCILDVLRRVRSKLRKTDGMREAVADLDTAMTQLAEGRKRRRNADCYRTIVDADKAFMSMHPDIDPICEDGTYYRMMCNWLMSPRGRGR